MKLLFTSLLFSLAVAEQQNRGLQEQYSDAGALAARWDMSEPTIDYEETTDTFTFTFMQASEDNFDAGLEESFWNPDCMPAEIGLAGVAVDAPLIQSIGDENTLPELVMTDLGGGIMRPQMIFKIDPAEFSTGNVAGTYTTSAGTAVIDFCIRSSLGYTITPGAALPNNYQEVNFIETLVNIQYNMAAGFTVDAFAVAPKDRQLTTIEESYEDALLAYLCIGPQHPDYDSATHDEQITLDNGEIYTKPKELTDYNAVGGTGKKFNQGSLINVCVQVKDEFATQDIVLKEILSFSWIRTGGTTYDASIGGGSGANAINQVAIAGSAPAGNWLTSYDATRCLNNYWCDFASVLFAQFYNTDGTVSGAGDASLQFLTRRRRLGEGGEQRRLQEDPGAAGMDISIDVSGEAEGPGDLKTAGGASKATAFASAVAFVGAALLA